MKRKLTPRMAKFIVDMLETTLLNHHDIADAWGVCDNLVWEIAKKHNIKDRKKGYNYWNGMPTRTYYRIEREIITNCEIDRCLIDYSELRNLIEGGRDAL